MELLRKARTGGVCAGMLLLAACHPAREEQALPGSRFPHQPHVEQGMECADCHAGVLEEDAPGMPPEVLCALCHEGLDAEKPPGRQVAALLAAGELEPRHVARLPEEVLFSHLAHVGANLECATCHGPVGESTSLSPEVAVDMAECRACHARTGQGDDCATCHREIRQDRQPPSHRALWLELHGEVARGHSGERREDCTLCHQESSCTTCHLNDPPRTHTEFWRRRGHGQSAAFDRRSCATCHDSDSCDRCHSEVRPPSHGARWGGTRSEHCFSCHLPSRAESCSTCHRGLESHALAPPRPATHFPGMDCRQCHGLTAPLPHVDDGSDCTLCHS